MRGSAFSLLSQQRRSPGPDLDGKLSVKLGTFLDVRLLPSRFGLKRIVDGQPGMSVPLVSIQLRRKRSVLEAHIDLSVQQRDITDTRRVFRGVVGIDSAVRECFGGRLLRENMLDMYVAGVSDMFTGIRKLIVNPT